MADPLSITVGILAILGACSTSVKAIRSVYAAPKELAHLERELDHLKDVVKDIEGLAAQGGLGTDSLLKNVAYARDKAQEVHYFIQNDLSSEPSASKKVRRRTVARQRARLKGFTGDIKIIRDRVADCLAISNLSYTLQNAARLSSVNRMSSPEELLTLAVSVGPAAAVLHTRGHAESSSAIRPRIDQEQVSISPKSGHSRADETQEQTLKSIVAMVEKTHQAVVTENISLHRHIAQIYREIGESRAEMHDIMESVSIYRSNKRREPKTVSNESFDGLGTVYNRPSSVISLDSVSDAVDVFFDCVSRFSDDVSRTPVERLRSSFSGPPEYFLEAGSAFYPERYTSGVRSDSAINVVAMKETECTSTYRCQKYFLMYAKTPRAWRRVTVDAIVFGAYSDLMSLEVAAPDVILTAAKTLPRNLQHQLQTVLQTSRILETVTKFSLTVTEDSNGGYMIEKLKTIVEEDLEEIRLSDEDLMLQDIEDMGCPWFIECEIAVRNSQKTSYYVVQVRSRTCLERKIPFAGAGVLGDNRVKGFFTEIKALSSMRSCKSLIEFVGVVLDNTKTHLRSYLLELPALGYLEGMFVSAGAKGERIPWPIREAWAKQIVAAVADVHAKGFVLGLLNLHHFGVRSDGSIVLDPPKAATSYPSDYGGQCAPELRGFYSDKNERKDPTFRTDLFQLGLVLWVVAEHRANTFGYFCLKNACTCVPRYSCGADHSNPVELGSCSRLDVPPYFDSIVECCRRTDPKLRVPARTLLHRFDPKASPPNSADIATRYGDVSGESSFLIVYCNECGTATTELHFHCNVCYLSDFDLCPKCVSQGIHCFKPQHRLVKRVLKGGAIINAS